MCVLRTQKTECRINILYRGENTKMIQKVGLLALLNRDSSSFIYSSILTVTQCR